MVNEEKIAAMREGGKIMGNLLKDLKNYVQPGMTGKEVDAWVRQEIVKRGATVAYDDLKKNFPVLFVSQLMTNQSTAHLKTNPLKKATRFLLISSSATKVTIPTPLLP